MKDDDPGNTGGQPKERPSSLPGENFQTLTQAEGMEAESAGLPKWS